MEYVHRRDNTRKPATSLFAEQVGQLLCAFGGDLQTAIRAKAEIFESDATYASVFPVGIPIGHIFAIQTLGWAYDRVKQELKSKLGGGSATEIEQRELKLIDYPASKQFLVRVVGELREEIAGRGVKSPEAFQLADEYILPLGEPATEAWAKVLRAILPILVQGLPAEEYQVVRSTEHTATVIERTKGIVAGAEVLQAGCGDLRALLKPV